MTHKIKINDEEYIRVSDVIEPIDEKSEPLRIIMSDDRGLCLVGNCNLSENQGWLVTIRNAKCIIRWGTTGHLAELADNGPLPNTKLGYAYTQKIPRQHIGLVIDCNAEKWK